MKRPRGPVSLLPLNTLLLMMLSACSAPSAEPGAGPTRSPVEALVAGDAQDGYARAEVVRELVFPEDHGPHPDFQTEWWYFTGHLESESGRRFGMQWTLFRRALTADMPARSSAWASRQLYMGHLALTDPEKGWHLSEERFVRGGAGLAGAQSTPFWVWLEDWQASSEPGETIWPLRLEGHSRTDRGEFSLDLRLTTTKPMILQGDRGLSRKHEGGASYYYSFTRLDALGQITVNGEGFRVSGSAWLDREWSTSTLATDQTGWDWFSLQLSDSRELMFYLLRLEDGMAHPMSSGVLVAGDGTSERLALEDVELESTATWKSPRSGGVYPSRWRLRVPSHALELEIVPLIEDQELDVQFRYWEGAVDVQGQASGANIEGRGYVELVGYADRPAS